MSVERSFEAWEEVQRHGHDLADRLAQGLTVLIQSHMNPPPFTWPTPPKSKLFDLEFPTQNFGKRDFGFATDNYGIDGVSAIFDIGNRIGQAGADFGASLNGLVQQFFRSLPMPFKQEDTVLAAVRMEGDKGRLRADTGITMQEDLGSLTERLRNHGFAENDTGAGGSVDEEVGGFNLSSAGLLGRRQVKSSVGVFWISSNALTCECCSRLCTSDTC